MPADETVFEIPPMAERTNFQGVVDRFFIEHRKRNSKDYPYREILIKKKEVEKNIYEFIKIEDN